MLKTYITYAIPGCIPPHQCAATLLPFSILIPYERQFRIQFMTFVEASE